MSTPIFSHQAATDQDAAGSNIRPPFSEYSAIVYCEGQFGEQDGKTANGLVRHSEKYEILSVIDSTQAGSDAGMFLDGMPNGVPVLANLAEAIAHADRVPDYLIWGTAPADGLLSASHRGVLLYGIA